MTRGFMNSACDEQQTRFVIISLEREYGSAAIHTLAEVESRLQGEIDGSSAGLLIDLGETIYIGCGLLNVLLRSSARARENNRRFTLCALNALPETVLATTRLDSLWEIFGTRQDAIEALQRPLDNG